MPKTTPKYAFLLHDPDTKRWHEALSQNSHSTAQGYLERLGLFLARTGHQAPAFLSLPAKQRDDAMSDYITDLHRRRRSTSAMRLAKAAVASWLDWHGEKFTRRFKFPKALAPSHTSRFRIPDQATVGRIFDAGDARERLAAVLEGQAGLRPGILGDKTGSSGLQFYMLPEARLTPTGIEFDRIPTMIKVPAHLNKVRHGFFTFLGPEGCAYLAADVQKRIQAGEKLTPESAVVPPTKGERAFLATWSVSQLIRAPLRRAGIQEPPYILRSYFANRCMMAHKKSLQGDWKEFFMGHAGTISATYSINKGFLPDDTVEAMREGYEGGLEFLETRQYGTRRDPLVDVVRALLVVAGVPEDHAKGLNPAKMTGEEVVALVRQHQPKAVQAPVSAPVAGLARATQRIVTAGELDALIVGGWRFLGNLGDGRFIVEGC